MKRPGSLTRSRLRRKAKRRDPAVAGEALAWWEAVGRQPIMIRSLDETVIWGEERHHPVPRSVCRKHGAPEWDPRNGMRLTATRHRRHHSRHDPLLRSELPASVFEFVADYPKLRPYLDRIYPQ